jgi:hypothetical protein
MKKTLFIFLILAMTTSCGFKIIDPSSIINFEIGDFKSSGDSRVNFKIKNNIIFSSTNNSGKLIYLNLHTKKTKNIKEKNINNETTKFQITVNAKIEIKNISDEKIIFYKSETAEYNVDNKRYSQTLTNEKKAIETISNSMADEIIAEITLILNDI